MSFIRTSGRTWHIISFTKLGGLGLNMNSGGQSVSLVGRHFRGGTGILLFRVHRIFFYIIYKDRRVRVEVRKGGDLLNKGLRHLVKTI